MKNVEKNIYLNEDNSVKAFWWTLQPNFGDVITPWLIKKMTGLNAILSDRKSPHIFAVGSIASYVTSHSLVWGSGSFGTEGKTQLNPNAKYLAVRGPLTRNKLRINGIDCPEVYGDPGLLLPDFYWPLLGKVYEVGVVLRHSESKLFKLFSEIEGVKVISLRSENIEGIVDDMLSCKRILSSSLHGLIVSDAYGIPNAWLETGSPHGLDFKYYDYFLSVNKIQIPYSFDKNISLSTMGRLIRDIEYNDKLISLNLTPLRGFVA